MIIYAIIRNIETNKDVAIIAHDPELGRAVFKIKNSARDLERSINLHYDRSIIVQEPTEVNGYLIVKRRRSVTKDSDYLNNLLDKSVKIPYEVRMIKKIKTNDKLDNFIEKIASEYLIENSSGKVAQFKIKPPYIKRIGSINGFTVWEVDGGWIRDHLDPDFTNTGQYWRWKFIPKNEFWIDHVESSEDVPFYIINLLVEHSLMARGIPCEEARSEAYRVEQKERAKALGKKNLEHVKKEKLGVVGNQTVWLVNGKAVRDVHVRFKEGGHDLVYPWIPNNEIWIDDALPEKERGITLRHETTERDLMEQGWSYLAAHTQSLKDEWQVRHLPLKKLDIIPLPFTKQEKSYSCGASALQSVLFYYGIPVKEDTLITELGTTEKGTPPENIKRVVEQYGLRSSIVENLSIEDLRRFVMEWDIPVIIAYQAWRDTDKKNWKLDWEDGHYSSVIGVDRKNVYLDDPSEYGVVGYVSHQEFLERWHDVDPKGNVRNRLGIIIVKD